MKIKLAVIAGDGIGPEVIREAVRVLETVSDLEPALSFEFTLFPWGCGYYRLHGEMMSPDAIDILSGYDAILLGAVGDPSVPDHISLKDLLLKIRQSFDQYVNLRPVRLLAGAPTPLSGVKEEDVDMLFVRENSEGEYAGSGAWLYRDTPNELVIQNSVFSRRGCERIMRYAFELARSRGMSVTSVSKANALNYSMVFWDQIFDEVRRDYPDVSTQSLLVDAAAMFMVRDPARFQVVVTSNLFGDILTDLGAAIAGGMGLAAGANINPERTFPSMFEAIHGSAPDIAGLGIANPFAQILAAGQLLSFFGFPRWEVSIRSAMEEMLTKKVCLTPDLFGSSSTGECADELIRRLRKNASPAGRQP